MQMRIPFIALTLILVTCMPVNGTTTTSPTGTSPSVSVAPDRCFDENDQEYQLGDIRYDECDECICTRGTKSGFFICQRKECPDVTESESPVCLYTNQTYNIGATRSQDCNTCTCDINGIWSCSTKICVAPDICIDENSKIYQLGDLRYDECDECICTRGTKSGFFICERKECPDPPAVCTYNNQTYNMGATHSQDCNTCTCNINGMWSCSTRICVTPDRCYAEGQEYKLGDIRYDECDECVCTRGTKSGFFICQRKECPDVTVPVSVSPDRCIDENDQVYKLGDIRYDECDECICTRGATSGFFICERKECPEPEPICQTCAATLCMTGTTCMEKNCIATCQPIACKGKKCVITLTFTLHWTGIQKATLINDAMRKIAEKAGVTNNFVINNVDIQQKSGGKQRWNIKIGFKGETLADRKSARNQFLHTLNQLQQVKDVKLNAVGITGWGLIDENHMNSNMEMMKIQTCGDGSEMSVEQQCPMVDELIVPASTSSSSSSTPIAVIIAPIVAGIVLITAIATAIIIIRRRRIKTMKGMETQMSTNPAITSQV